MIKFNHHTNLKDLNENINEKVTVSTLNPKTITGNQTRLDISALGVWTPFDKTFLNIRVPHPNCLSNRTKTLKEVYERKTTILFSISYSRQKYISYMLLGRNLDQI